MSRENEREREENNSAYQMMQTIIDKTHERFLPSPRPFSHEPIWIYILAFDSVFSSKSKWVMKKLPKFSS